MNSRETLACRASCLLINGQPEGRRSGELSHHSQLCVAATLHVVNPTNDANRRRTLSRARASHRAQLSSDVTLEVGPSAFAPSGFRPTLLRLGQFASVSRPRNLLYTCMQTYLVFGLSCISHPFARM